MSSSLGFRQIVVMTLATVANTRNISASYAFSDGVLFHYFLVCFLFFIPASLLVCVCTASFPSDQGVFDWVSRALGRPLGALAVWLQWLENVFYYPLSLLFIISSVAQAFNVQLDALTLSCATNVVFWFLTWVNARGVVCSSRWVTVFTVLGLFLPLMLLGLASLQASSGPLVSSFVQIGPMDGMRDALLISLASFLGVEINTVHVASVRTPGRLPLAIFVGALGVLCCMVGGVWSMLFWLQGQPATVGNALAYALELSLPPMIGHTAAFWVVLLMLLGPLGGMTVWILGPVYALHHMLQSVLGVSHTPSQSALLWMQAVLVSLLSVCYFFFDVYDLFMLMNDAMVGLYLLMYALFFMAVWRLKCATHFLSLFWVRVCCVLGLISCLFGEFLCLWNPKNSAFFLGWELLFLAVAIGGPYAFFRCLKKS